MTLDEVPIIPKDAIDRYLERRREDLVQFQAALVGGDYPTIEQRAHRLKGNGATFGFPEVSLIGDHLEKAAQDKNIPELNLWLQKLSEWLALT